MMTTPPRDPQRGIAVSEDCGDDQGVFIICVGQCPVA
jgi:hypothetical protein